MNSNEIPKQENKVSNDDILFSIRPDPGILWFLIFIYSFFIPIFIIAILSVYFVSVLNSVNSAIKLLGTNFIYLYMIGFPLVIAIMGYFRFKETLKNQIFHFSKNKCVLYTGLLFVRKKTIYYSEIITLRTDWPFVLIAQQLGVMTIKTRYSKIKLYGLREEDEKKINQVIEQANTGTTKNRP